MSTNVDLSRNAMSSLVDIYNDAAVVLGHKPVTRFRDRETAVRRATEAFKALREHRRKVAKEQTPLPAIKAHQPVAKDVPTEVTPALKPTLPIPSADPAKDAQMPQLRRGSKSIDLRPAKTVYARREGTRQALLVDLLSRPQGATFGELYDVMAATGKPWQGSTIRSGLAWDMNHVAGYGISSELLNGMDFAVQGRVYEAERMGVRVIGEHGVPGPAYDALIKSAVYRLVYPKGMEAPLPHTPKKGG